MLFVLMGMDRPGDGAEVRRRNRAAHLQFVVENEDKFRYGGALLDDNQKMVGSLMMVELPDRQALDAFLKAEPYSRAGLFEPYIVRETRQVVPQRVKGFLAAELASEKARSG
ncbi:MAG TPA: YciI family protein [Stellaceae bacterium]|nr:YciI family protein [Stellaceae bacterium]